MGSSYGWATHVTGLETGTSEMLFSIWSSQELGKTIQRTWLKAAAKGMGVGGGEG